MPLKVRLNIETKFARKKHSTRKMSAIFLTGPYSDTGATGRIVMPDDSRS